MPRQVIVNADDFGLSACENAVILGAFQAGLISSATAIAGCVSLSWAAALSGRDASNSISSRPVANFQPRRNSGIETPP